MSTEKTTEKSETLVDSKLILQRKRSALKGNLTKIFNLFCGDNKNEATEFSLQQLLIKQERILATFEKYELINLEIISLDPNCGDTDPVEEKYYDALSTIRELISNKKQNEPRCSSSSIKPTKLPDINVPTFTEKRALALENAERPQEHTEERSQGRAYKVAHMATFNELRSPKKCILFLITAYGIQLMWRCEHSSRRLLVLGALVLAAGGVARTHLRNRDWRTRETLLRADLAVLPHNAKLHYNFANFLKDVEQQENAVKHYKEALRLWPSYASAHNNLGTLVLASGRAEHHFLQALKYNRDHVNAHYNLAKLYRKKNRIPEALKMLERCITLEPRFVLAYLELLVLTPVDGRRWILDKLLELEPKNWEHHLLYGNWFKERGLVPIALHYYSSSLRLSLTEARGRAAGVRAACLALRARGQRARILQLITRWHVWCGDSVSARRRSLAARAWRLRTELSSRAKLYSRPAPDNNQPTSTCLHHSQLEVSKSFSNKLEQQIEDSRTIHYTYNTQSDSEVKLVPLDKFSCVKTEFKKSVSLPTVYKPTHNKSDTGHKLKSCPMNKQKKMKTREAYTPYVSDHLIKTY